MELLRSLREIVGKRHLLTRPDATRRYRTGFRFGSGDTLAVVRPGTLLEQWQVLDCCVRAGVIVISQASNTGLTGGSTPDGDDYDRDVVIVSVARLAGIFVLDGGQQVVCLPGATLHALERRLQPLGREPHSVIGSSCFGASVIGGVCNNSGGALTRRGPAYTEMALFAQVDADSTLRLVNHLGIDLGDAPEQILERLQAGRFDDADVRHDRSAASAHDYPRHVRDVDADTPARFNADPRCLFEASGSAGKMMVFAVRLDTFEAEPQSQTFYVGCNDPADLGKLRRLILTECASLPIAGEYIHRDAFDLADRYGKDQFVTIERLGTGRLPSFFAFKSRIDAALARLRWLPENLTDRLLFALGKWWPDHLPARLRQWRDRFAHHLLLRVSADAADEMRALLDRWRGDANDWFACTATEARKAFLHRFVVAGAAVRYRAIHPRQTAGIVALDIALRRNDTDWFEALPADLDAALVHKIYYGHFLCHVLHQDYIVAPGHDCLGIEHRMWALLDSRGARYPAEHNVGHLYPAEPALADFYRTLDPGNRFNAGIGGMSKKRDYAS
ncbi:D-lactate dehydrogenase [Hephaestia sp. GCM10023244]|uniref:D-lactate dehydrogenase n=1 Tax=unclassified Hephaestia TaxID=2631281 RepID=UPI002076F153|nr:D-lactate dehydrogenase [Hephaestia sp. MAHUQ-44]MCM8730271.1 D-lactate dehydrogenase [Hephaestia sp. MAHUQ-44]